MTIGMAALRTLPFLLLVLTAGPTDAFPAGRTVYGVATVPRSPDDVAPMVPTTGTQASRRPIDVPLLARGLPPGYIAMLPAGYRVVVIRGVRHYAVGGIRYRPLFYQGRTYYRRVNP